MIAALGMYPFAHLRDAYDALWVAVRAQLADGPDSLDIDIDIHDSWLRDDLLLGQTCGWPLVARLTGTVEVVGAFDVAVPFAREGTYRSVLVASKPLGVAEWRADPSTVCAVNGMESLSGWISLQWAWGGVPPRLLETGAHVESVRAVAEGRAHLAAIDGVSWEFITESQPALAGRVNIVGHGPVIGTLPLVTSKANAHRVGELRAGLAAAVEDPLLAPALARLRIRGFVPCGLEAYSALPALLPAG
ncbi:MAG: PhnD/SsuA/transferrin family substrate-binding protein [Ilumatobacteraceae bacterium]